MATVTFSAAFVSGDPPRHAAAAAAAALTRRAPALLPAAVRAKGGGSWAARATAAEAAPEAGKRRPRGITKPRPISPELQELVGVKEIPRTQALKLIWAYIKENNLQDPENKRIVVCDEKLKKIFGGKDRVGFLEISGLLNPHFMK
ncbi:upstream activation factor subunit spp27-like [Ananas comosus]|uniref:Upstream activation factor subunit spp27 n=1 Tax=Ananas comosus TaxID=4615 RepID=A0A199US68_ANACO|nr:upstream activation factor subunit spp27-like [Ananas comosus]OAY67599.1 Upstream activation factor subunit spp27 [Ananas comosus]